MKLDNRPDAVKIDIPMSDLSTVSFTQMLLEQVMVTAGTTEVRAGKIRDQYVIGAGKLRFAGQCQDEAVRKFLYWLLTSSSTITAEEYAEEAKHFFDMEDRETAELIETLTKDGMSDFGKKVQEYRQERGGKLAQALTAIEAEAGHIPTNISTLQDELQRRTGYDDLDTREVLAAVVDLRKMLEVVDSTMVN